ncbi:MAG TPA: hydroxymethylbilane synthase [Deltaproteobacteria bacterium]|nr:hydroxymethylbilane synthase [Deltaproteobacteria bacterium]
MKTIRIGTRGSALAIVQTEIVRCALAEIYPDIETHTRIIKTKGDVLCDVPLDTIGGKGVFVKDIEKALLAGQIDIAVHSLKDMQASLPEGLVIGAYLQRANPRDMLFSRGNDTLAGLPSGSTVGTSSMRRRCQIRSQRPDLKIVDIRGNVQTRLKKIGKGVDAVILAAAGIIRLNLAPGIALDITSMIPSPGQGIIAIQTRADDHDTTALVSAIDHFQTRICGETERSFLAMLGQDCNLPAGAYATFDEHDITILGMLGSTDETRMESMSMMGSDPSVGTRLARALMERIHRERVK